MTLGETLRRFRDRANNMSPADLAADAKVDLSTIAAIERGKRPYPHPTTIARLAASLKLTPRDRVTLERLASRSPRAWAPDVIDPAVERVPLFGRDADVRRLDDLLSERRLVTIVGHAGVGKTLLARHVRSRAAARYADGAYVACGVVDDVADAVARALGIAPDRGASPVDAVFSALCERQALIVVNGCEAVLDRIARFVEALLARCPNVDVLTTSTERLNVDGEWVYSLRGLDPGPAAALLLARCRELDVSQALLDACAGLLVELVRTLGGNPWALQAVAPHVRDALRPQNAVVEGEGARLVPTILQALARDASLATLLEPSLRRLTTEELAFLEAASASVPPLASGPKLRTRPAPTCREVATAGLDVRSSLVEQSLLDVDLGRDRPRYTLPPLVRLYSAAGGLAERVGHLANKDIS